MKILSYVTRLSKTEKLIFTLASFFVSLAVLDRLIVGPIFARMKLLDEKIRTQQELIRKNARIVAEKERIQTNVQQLSSFSRKAASQEEEIAFLLGEVERLARKSSLYVIDMKPLGAEEDTISRKYSVDLNCEAQMEQFFNFMHEIESSNMLFVIETFNISPKSKESSIAKCNMKISNVIFL